MTRSFYDVLGVSADATTEEIRAAYRERLKESHPDRNDAENARAATKRIIRARDVLTDEDERERYDRIGHAAFVGRADTSVDDGDVSRAAAAARRSGWATRDSAGEPSGSAGAGGRRKARERRRRERAARERTQGGNTDDETNGQEHGGTSSDGDTTTTTGGDVSDDSRFWNATDGFSVRQRRSSGPRRRPLFASSESITLLCVAFVLYPIMLFSAVFPPFPLVVNVVVGLCIVFLVGYLQSIPEVGVFVFGAWSLATPIAFAIAGLELVSIVGLVALAGTWFPLGLSVATFSMFRR